MSRNKHTESDIQSPPRQMAETTPPNMGVDQHSWILQSVMEMQKNVGQLTQAVGTLTEQTKEQGKKLDSISHRIYAGSVILGLLIALLLFILNKIPWKAVLAVLNVAD